MLLVICPSGYFVAGVARRFGLHRQRHSSRYRSPDEPSDMRGDVRVAPDIAKPVIGRAFARPVGSSCYVYFAAFFQASSACTRANHACRFA